MIRRLDIAHLDPDNEETGARQRLANLDRYRDPLHLFIDEGEECTDPLRQALVRYQWMKQLTITAELDAATAAALREDHKS